MSPRTAAEASTATASTPNKPSKEKSSSSSSFFSLKGGCSNAKSISVSIPRIRGSRRSAAPAASSSSLSGRPHSHAFSARFDSSSGDTITLTAATTSTSHDEEEVEDDGNRSPSFSGLLRELSELERRVIAWDRRHHIPSGWCYTNETGKTAQTGEGEDTRRRAHDTAGDKAGEGKPRKDHRQRRQKHRRHRRSQSEGGYGAGAGGLGVGDVVGRMGGGVVVVTETEDPLGEFRRSMLQMIVEEDIVCPEELQELLRRFLALNSPSHHGLINRAFADIWRDVFSGDLDDFPYLIPPASDHLYRHLRRQYSYHGRRCY